jgi:hypothetical protein
MRLFQALRCHARPLREALSFHPTLDVLEDRLTPDSRLLGNPIVTTIGPVQSFVTYTNNAIDQANDVYLYQFQATGGYWFSAQTQTSAGNGAYLTTNLRLFDSTGQEIKSQVGFGYGNNGPSTNVLLDRVIPTTGTYYLGVAGNANTAYDPTTGTGTSGGATGHYDLQMSLWQMAGVGFQDRTLTLTGAANGGNRLEFYRSFIIPMTSSGMQGTPIIDDTLVYHPAGDPNTYYAFNPFGVKNYNFNLGAGGANQFVASNTYAPPVAHLPLLAALYRHGAQLSYGVNAEGGTVAITGADTQYVYGEVFNGDQAIMYDAPGENILAATVGYTAMTAAPGAALPYTNLAVGFGAMGAYRFFPDAVDRAYFYASGGGDQFAAAPASVRMDWQVNVNSGVGSAPQVHTTVYGFDSNVAYDQASTGSDRGPDVAFFTDGPSTDVFYADIKSAYMSGPSPFLTGRGYFNAVFTFHGASATSANGGNDTAYLLDAVHNSATGFAHVIT